MVMPSLTASSSFVFEPPFFRHLLAVARPLTYSLFSRSLVDLVALIRCLITKQFIL